MREDCIKAVALAAGRTLTAQEIKGIEDRVVKNMRRLAVEDRAAYLSMSPDQRLNEAAKLSAEQIVGEAAKKRQRIGLTIQKHDMIDNYMKSQEALHGFDKLESVKRVLAFVPDGKSNFQSVESRAAAIRNRNMSQLLKVWEETNPRILGLFADVDGMKALTYELFGQDSSAIVGPERAKAAKEAAKQWNEVTENMRKNYNNAGGEIGRLEDWRMPQKHSQSRIAKAGADKWVADILPSLDRKRYVNEDGTLISDAQLTDILKEVWTTIATGGANKVEPGKIVGKGMLAKRNAEERFLHFKDADSYLKYHEEYGGTSAYTTMVQHVLSLSHDMAFLDILGPNPDQQFKLWMDRGVQESKVSDPNNLGKVEKTASQLQDLYDFLSGKTKPVANKALAAGFDTLRSWLVATRLGSAFITSITDNATMRITAQVNGLSHTQLLLNQLQTLNPTNKKELQMVRCAGLSLQTYMGEINRWGTENLGATFSGKMASVTIRASLLNAATEARRRAFGVTMYGSIGSTVKDAVDLNSVDVHDQRLLKSKGITDTDFAVWKQASLEDWGGGNDTMLTPEAIYRIPDDKLSPLGDPSELRREATLKLMGMVDEEVNMAVIEPGAIDRSKMKADTRRGTPMGEIMRSFFLFKSFPMAMINKHFARGFAMPTRGGKVAYVSALIAASTIMGAAAQQVSNFVSGKDPDDMNDPRFWIASLLKGGSLGVYGDFLLNTDTSYGNSMLGILSGPVAGEVEDIDNLTRKNIVEAMKGRKTHAGGEAVRFLKNNLPLQNLWYTKAITDHMIFNQLQEMASPGYNRRVEQRAMREFGKQYYWPPGEMLPERGPDLGRAVGGQ